MRRLKYLVSVGFNGLIVRFQDKKTVATFSTKRIQTYNGSEKICHIFFGGFQTESEK